MTALAEHLCDNIRQEISAADAAIWDRIESEIVCKGLEVALLNNPPTPSLESYISELTASLISEKEKLVISEIFSGTRKLRLSRLLSYVIKSPSGIPIITTNYDRLVEIAAEEAGLGVDTMFAGRFVCILNERESQLSFCRKIVTKGRKSSLQYKHRVRVFKPHGSLDWYLRDGRPVSYHGDLPSMPRLIITPGHNKFRNGYDSPFDHHRSRANEAIDRAQRFLIIGYGFNDDHLETHLSPAIRDGKPALIITHSLSSKARQLALDFNNVIAIESNDRDGVSSSDLIIDKEKITISDCCLWDINSLITEVLEP